MSLAIDMCVKPRMGLLYFDSWHELQDWIFDNQDAIKVSNGIYNKTTNIITFPNGNRLVLGHGDESKYISYEFFFVLGDTELRKRVRI